MGRQLRGSSASRTRKGKLLARLRDEEAADVLRTLLERHPELADAVLDQVPEWAAMIERASKPPSRKR